MNTRKSLVIFLKKCEAPSYLSRARSCIRGQGVAYYAIVQIYYTGVSQGKYGKFC
jgi:hypothetical protein